MRDRKHFSGRKRASCPPLADSECAAAPCKKLSEKANAFFDKLRKGFLSREPFHSYSTFSPASQRRTISKPWWAAMIRTRSRLSRGPARLSFRTRQPSGAASAT